MRETRDKRLTELLKLAARIHAEDRDLQGAPYIAHVLAVTGAVSDQAKPVAIFHDAIEDHPDTFRCLERELDVVELTAVLLLTKRPGDDYTDDYIERIATWPGVVGELAREVKLADLRHNVGRLTPRLERLRSKYERAIERLT